MNIVDLTYDIEEGMTTFHSEWHPEVVIEQLGTIPSAGRETRRISFGSHTGTHMDAPLHFIENGNSIEDLSLETLLGPVTVVDFTDFEENEAVTESRLQNVDLSPRMIFRFGWEDQWGDAEDFYFDYPYFTKDAAEYLVDQGVQLMGFDTPSPDASHSEADGSDEDSPVHKILLGNDVVLVEYLKNLGKLDTKEGWMLAALPMKVPGADGMPARVVAWK
jgi:arylformamidase